MYLFVYLFCREADVLGEKTSRRDQKWKKNWKWASTSLPILAGLADTKLDFFLVISSKRECYVSRSRRWQQRCHLEDFSNRHFRHMKGFFFVLVKCQETNPVSTLPPIPTLFCGGIVTSFRSSPRTRPNPEDAPLFIGEEETGFFLILSSFLVFSHFSFLLFFSDISSSSSSSSPSSRMRAKWADGVGGRETRI